MLQGVAKPEDMDAPGDNIIVLNRIHIFPSKLEMLAKGEAMDVYLGSSSKDIGLSAELLSSTHGKDLDCHSIDIIDLLVGKIDNDLIEAIVLSSLESDALVV
jgi:hypothetical protein